MLRSLEISGFKSFARPVRLDLPPGITALVGPNGSGKSNIVDAVRWCLGEQSMRDLRGQKSEDVIYAGTRKVLGAAEVALTFDSSSPSVLHEWSEVCVSRRLYRSGESDYGVNRQKSRLRDVQDVLRRLGIDAGRNVIVTQGMADALLTATPAERRGLLEQAAGLSAYRDRRDDTRHKLSAVAQNIERVELVLAEMEPRVKLLRRQARAVEERAQAGERLRTLLTSWYGWEYGDSLARREGLAVELAAVSEERKTATEHLTKLEEELEATLELERSWHSRLSSSVAALHLSERERDAARADEAQLHHTLDAAHTSLQEVDRLMVSLLEGKRGVLQRLSDAETSLQASSEQAKAESELLNSIQLEWQKQRSELGRSTQRGAERRTAHERAEHDRQRLSRRISDLEDRMRRLEERAIETQRRQEQTSTEVDGLSGLLEGVETTLCEARAQEDRACADLDRLVIQWQAHAARTDRLAAIRSRVRLALQDANNLHTRATRAFDRSSAEVEGGVVAALDVLPGWERAVASALGEWASVRIDDTDRFHRGDSHQFLAWRNQVQQDLGKEVTWGDDVVTGLPAPWINPLSGTLLEGNEESAARLWAEVAPLSAFTIGSPPIQVVARSGSRWSASGVTASTGDTPGVRYLELRREVEVLDRRVRVLCSRLQRIDTVREREAAEAEVLQGEIGRLETTLRAARAQVHDRMDERERLLRRRKQAEVQAAEAAAELARVTGDIEGLRVESVQASREHTVRVAEAESALTLYREHQRTIREQQDGVAALAAQMSERRKRLDVLAAQEVAQRTIVDAAMKEVSRLQAEVRRLEGRRQRLCLEVENAVRQREIAAAKMAQLEVEVRARREIVDKVRAQPPSGGDRKEALRHSRQRLSEIVSRHERLLAALSHVHAEVQGVEEEVRFELGLDPSQLPVHTDPPPGADEIRKLRSRVAQGTDLDDGVVQEYRDLLQRQEYLHSQIQDLRSASDNLSRIMQVADREMQDRYRDTFAAVSERFALTFATMLRGGQARLVQIDEDGSVEVNAQLPGRRSRTSTAFSGGERSLVASALLFAVLGVRPAPFCILDEVDAALDESNVDRYLSVLRDMSRHTQMIVVTHNRATMAAADVLYGLTMDDEGASSLLSLRLDAYQVAL